MKSYRLFSRIAVLLVALGVIAPACSGSDDGDGLTLEEYFQQFEILNDEAQERGEALRAELRETPTSSQFEADEHKVRQERARYSGIATISDEMHGELAELDPPEAVRDAHEAYLAGLSDLADGTRALASLESLDDFVAEVQNVESRTELEELLAEFSLPDVATASDRLNEVCAELERIAAQNEIDFDLCDDSPSPSS